MNKLIRNLSTDATRAFWRDVEESARLVRDAPDWMKAGVNLSDNYITYREDVSGERVEEA